MKTFVITTLAALSLPSVAFANPVVSSSGNARYSVTEVDEETHTINIAIPAGHAISAKLKGTQLTVSGANQSSNSKVVFSNYKNTGFQYTFKLKSKSEVNNLTLSNGILQISVATELPVDQKTKTLSIK